MTTTTQLVLLAGVPSAFIVLSALDSHRRFQRLARKLDSMSADLNRGAAAGKTISTEAVLKRLLESKTTYEGPNREEYVAEVDRLADDFRKEHGPEIPADQAYAMLKELEARFGRVE